MPISKVHMIGQAHLDPVWLWTWTEGRAEALATSQSAVDRLDEFPAFQFTRGEAQVYRWIEQEDPVLFARIRELIHAGRWHPVNGMIVQPDMNLPQGESFVRHFLLGKGYMREHLGVEPQVAYCVDSFGHAVTLPQIFRKCGCPNYVFMRPGPSEMELPQAFRWQAPDGSQVTTFRITGGYTTDSADQAAHIDIALEAKADLLGDTMSFFGVGDHGGGPTIAQIENIQALASERAGKQAILFSSPAAFFEAIQPLADQLPVVDSELYFHAIGCYAANSQLKRAHRKAECALLNAERLASLAGELVSHPAPVERLRELWWSLCFNQFHDILGGCTIKPGADDAIAAFHAIQHSAGEIANDAGRAIAARVNTLGAGGSKKGGTVLLFNPSAQDFNGYVEYEPWTGWEAWVENGWGLVDENGQACPYQLITTDEALSKRDVSFGICRLLWRVEIPACGYRLYRFAPGLAQADPLPALSISPEGCENEHLRLRIDPTSGAIVSCLDKASGIELVGKEGWNVAQILDDQSDTWSHAVTHFGEEVGRFGKAAIKVCEQGPLQGSLLVERTAELEDGTRGRWLQQIILRRGEKEILVRNWLAWDGHFKAVKLAFDLAAEEVSAVHHVPFGWTPRPTDGSERAAQFWVDLQGKAAGRSETIGLALLNDGKYSCDVSGTLLRQTVLRCPPYAYHNPPHTYGTKPRYEWLDQGTQEFTLILRPHSGDWREGNVQQRANELNLPPVAITQHAHPGSLPPRAGLCALSSEAIELTALKPAEDGQGLVLRAAERHARPAQVELRWMEQTFPLSFGPLEVKTLRLARGAAGWSLSETDMLERSAS